MRTTSQRVGASHRCRGISGAMKALRDCGRGVSVPARSLFSASILPEILVPIGGTGNDVHFYVDVAAIADIANGCLLPSQPNKLRPAITSPVTNAAPNEMRTKISPMVLLPE